MILLYDKDYIQWMGIIYSDLGLPVRLMVSCFFQVYIFHLLEDEKFVHFKPVMDTYIANHFFAPLVYR